MITINHKEPNFIITFPYNLEDLHLVQNLPVRTFNKKNRNWEIPQLCVKTLEFLSTAYWTDNALERKRFIEKALLNLIDYKFKSGEPNGFIKAHQVIASDYLVNAKKALLADGLGTGKSLSSIVAMEKLNAENNLILCPATLLYNWENEFKKHYNIEPLVISGTKEKREKLWKEKNKYKIVSYDMLRQDYDIMPENWDVITADELVYLKTHRGTNKKEVDQITGETIKVKKINRTQRAKKLKSDYRFGLSGYYIENNLMEFHSMMEFLRPGLLSNEFSFKQRYCNLDFWGSIVGYKNLEELHQITSPFLLRRTEEDLFPNLKKQHYIPVELEFDKNQQKAYNAIVKEFIDWLNSNSKVSVKSALEKTIRLRQFVEFPETLGFNLKSTKLEFLQDFIKDKGRVVVFSYFKDSVDLLCKYLNTPYKITSDVGTKERFNVINRFDNDNKPIICTDAGKFGVNFTSADYIIHFGYFYNPATVSQRNGRLRRMWRDRETYIIEPYYKNSIDEGIRKVYLQRDRFVKEFINGDICMSMAKLSKKDFEKLVYGDLDI